MTDQDKNAHLLRRFGLGASLQEKATYASTKPDDLMDHLLDVKNVDGPINPLRFAFLPKVEAQPNAYRFRNFWVYEMLTTHQPLREKQTVFWHNHFAVSDNKIEDGLAILQYLQVLRANPLGKFEEILQAMAKSVAVMKQLDVEMLSKARPNENFAREVLELYTLGVGNYTEHDINQLAKVLTGWATVGNFYTLGKTNDERIGTMVKNGSWASSYAYVPGFHDDTPREILGATVSHPDEMLTHLARHPKTAEFICTKLWKFYASPTVIPSGLEAMINTWHKTDGHIGSVLKTLSQRPEFYSDAVVRNQPKSPIDYVIGTARAQGAGSEAELLHDTGEFNKPVPDHLDGMLGEAASHIALMGYDMLYIPSVAGYPGGAGWISPEFVPKKLRYNGLRSYVPYLVKNKMVGRPGRTMLHVAKAIKDANPKTSLDMAVALCTVYDTVLTDAQLKIVAAFYDKNGGMKLLANDDNLAAQSLRAFGFLKMTPAYNMC